MFEASRYEIASCRVEPGDLIVMFTDGIIDLVNPRDDFFGVESLLRAVTERRELRPRALATEVFRETHRFCEGVDPADDLTLFLIRFQ
jgi:sigma-B regulation protein RsbU (phosphoserine phosphatase)